MPTVHRAGNLRFVVFPDDHGPPHVHVFSGRAEAKILLGSDDGGPEGDGPELEWARGFDRAGLRRVLVEAVTSRAKLRAAWRQVHGAEG